MRYYHLISVLSVLAVILLGSLAQPFSPRWDDMRIKHSWNAVPENWESLGNPGTSAHVSASEVDLLTQKSVPWDHYLPGILNWHCDHDEANDADPGPQRTT
ncbi:hypothetical protein EDB89DRAFT_2064534 [Lactarius sanguifluus]|nr:hypothetical protein EDB89DRAFT_2064534 [Lactarius sanguifluus]